MRTGLNVINFAISKDASALQSLKHDLREAVGDIREARSDFNDMALELVIALEEFHGLRTRADHLLTIEHAEWKRRFNHGLLEFQR